MNRKNDGFNDLKSMIIEDAFFCSSAKEYASLLVDGLITNINSGIRILFINVLKTILMSTERVEYKEYSDGSFVIQTASGKIISVNKDMITLSDQNDSSKYSMIFASIRPNQLTEVVLPLTYDSESLQSEVYINSYFNPNGIEVSKKIRRLHTLDNSIIKSAMVLNIVRDPKNFFLQEVRYQKLGDAGGANFPFRQGTFISSSFIVNAPLTNRLDLEHGHMTANPDKPLKTQREDILRRLNPDKSFYFTSEVESIVGKEIFESMKKYNNSILLK